MPKLLFSLAVVFLFYSISFAQSSDDFEHFEIDIRAKRVDFFEMVEHIEIIRLEETENSLLPHLEWYLRTPDGIAITEKENQTVKLFDLNGNYRNSIDRLGEGPEEYRGISNIWIKNQKIELWSGTSRVLQRYGFDGKYLETVKANLPIELWGGTMTPYSEGYLVQALDRSPKKRASFSLAFLDSNLKFSEWAMPIDNGPRFGINFGKRFRSLEGRLLYKRIQNDTIYEVHGKGIIPRFKFDFGEDWTWNDPNNNASMRKAQNAVLKGEKVYDVFPDIGHRHIILTYRSKLRRLDWGLIDRSTGKFSRLDFRKADRENYSINFMQWEDGRFVASIESYDFEEFVSNLGDEQYSVKGGVSIQDILTSENPILMRIKFK